MAASGPDPMADLPKIVFSRSLVAPLDWPNTTVIDTDVATAVPALKKRDGPPLRVIGSLSLGTSLLRLGLVDRLRLLVFPQLLGATGEQPAFTGLPDIDLRLDSSRVLDGRLVLLEYLPL